MDLKIYVLYFFLFQLFFIKYSYGQPLCQNIFDESTIELNSDELPSLINQPELFVNKKIHIKSNGSAGPLRIVSSKQLPTYLQLAITDLHILARNPNLREKVFGEAKRQKSLSKGALEAALNLRKLDDGVEGFLVEVGVEVFRLSSGRILYIYTTSNMRDSIMNEYDFFNTTMRSLNLKNESVVEVHSFHTHPLNLLPSVMDRDYFSAQLSLIKQNDPQIDFSKWYMYTTMETEKVLHRVDLKDWE